MENLKILKDCLNEKYEVMCKLNEMNVLFKENLQNTEDFSVESLEEFLSKKDNLINDLIKLEEKSENVFNKIKNDKFNQKNVEVQNISKILEKIQELSNDLEIKEKEIKKQVETFLSNERTSLNINRKTSSAAFNYYKIMNNFENIAPQFFDKKTN